jgi:hypothetical protein
MVAYVECSAKTGEGVMLAMEKAVRYALLVKSKKQEDEKTKSGGRRRFF